MIEVPQFLSFDVLAKQRLLKSGMKQTALKYKKENRTFDMQRTRQNAKRKAELQNIFTGNLNLSARKNANERDLVISAS